MSGEDSQGGLGNRTGEEGGGGREDGTAGAAFDRAGNSAWSVYVKREQTLRARMMSDAARGCAVRETLAGNGGAEEQGRVGYLENRPSLGGDDVDAQNCARYLPVPGGLHSEDSSETTDATEWKEVGQLGRLGGCTLEAPEAGILQEAAAIDEDGRSRSGLRGRPAPAPSVPASGYKQAGAGGATQASRGHAPLPRSLSRSLRTDIHSDGETLFSCQHPFHACKWVRLFPDG